MIELQILAVLSSDAVSTDSPSLDPDVAADVDDLLALPEAAKAPVDGTLPPMLRVVVASLSSSSVGQCRIHLVAV